MKLLFEKSVNGRGCDILPQLDVPKASLSDKFCRQAPPRLPELSETDISRHYTALAERTHGINKGFYPLGSCTMKYNPKINEEMACLPGFAGVHPLQPQETAQGALEVYYQTEKALCEITGMDAVSFQPAAGAHGELLGLLLIKAYHKSKNDTARTKIIVPDSAHGTNPASATMAGFTVVSIPSTEEGFVDLDKLKAAIGEDTAGLMLTNPNTLGLFDPNILVITRLIHEAGGLNYYDGANLNAIMGISRPGDMGFDVVHLNLHKTFSTPHGGGGPGSGPVGCKALLTPFLPGPVVKEKDGAYVLETPAKSIGRVKAFYGNFSVVVKTLCYILTLGGEGLREASQTAVLNANYMMKKLCGIYHVPFEKGVMHEFVLSLEKEKKETGISAMDIAKGLLEFGIHPPTMYFPLIVHEALMVEPTETESKETLDEAAEIFALLYKKAYEDPEYLHNCPISTPVRRLDEVAAARNPKLRYTF